MKEGREKPSQSPESHRSGRRKTPPICWMSFNTIERAIKERRSCSYDDCEENQTKCSIRSLFHALMLRVKNDFVFDLAHSFFL